MYMIITLLFLVRQDQYRFQALSLGWPSLVLGDALKKEIWKTD